MSYVAPGIDASGIHVPEYQDIKERLETAFRRIFGEDLYLGPDSQDGQMIAEFADLFDDVCSVAVDVFASRNPDYATGAALDYLLPLNGLRRLMSTYSTATVTASGLEGTVIPAGSLIQDADGRQWATNAEATIGSGGTVSIGVTCTQPGAFSAIAGSITRIMSPTAGWTSVTNASDAVTGRNTETDAEAHERRNASVSNGALSMIETVKGTLLMLSGVTKVRVYENKTGSTDANSIPANSLCAVVQGGDNTAIAQAIFRKKGPGCGTYGGTSVTVKDVYDQDNTISFSRPTDKAIAVDITIKRLGGFSDGMVDQIKANVKAYIESLGIGEDLNVGLLWACVLSVNTDMSNPVCTPVSVEAGISGGTMKTDAVTIAYNENMTCATADISVTDAT